MRGKRSARAAPMSSEVAASARSAERRSGRCSSTVAGSASGTVGKAEAASTCAFGSQASGTGRPARTSSARRACRAAVAAAAALPRAASMAACARASCSPDTAPASYCRCVSDRERCWLSRSDSAKVNCWRAAATCSHAEAVSATRLSWAARCVSCWASKRTRAASRRLPRRSKKSISQAGRFRLSAAVPVVVPALRWRPALALASTSGSVGAFTTCSSTRARSTAWALARSGRFSARARPTTCCRPGSVKKADQACAAGAAAASEGGGALKAAGRPG